MSQRYEVDLESERIQLDGAWLSSEELSQRITQAIAAKNFGGVGRLGEALEQLAQAVSAARSLTLKLSGEQFAKLEAVAQKLGKAPEAIARDMLVQVLSGQAPQPVSAPPPMVGAPPVIAPIAPPPVIAAPPPVVAAPPPVVAAPPVMAPVAEVSPEEAAAALAITPKRRDAAAPPPPVMTPTAPPPPAGPQPSVVVDLAGEADKPKAGSNDQRRWFNRS